MFLSINNRSPFKFSKVLIAILGISTLGLTGCGDDDDDDGMTMVPTPMPTPVVVSYEVSVLNLTAGQPMSPITVVLHNEGNLWEIGASANEAMELLAESGDNSKVVDLDVVLASASGAGVLMPGMSETISVSITDTVANQFSLATMLVNTNDAFTGVNSLSVENLAVGESISLQTSSYDSGTEKNSEMMSTIPGPAAGGEGFNVERDDVDYVAMHPGVVTSDDGLTDSALFSYHRFDNPTLRVTITRTE